MACTCPPGIRWRPTALWTEACGTEPWRGDLENVERDHPRRRTTRRCGACASDARARRWSNTSRKRVARQVAGQGGSAEEIADAGQALRSSTRSRLGFARRFATYKRPNLLLHDPERLIANSDAIRSGPFSSSWRARRIRRMEPGQADDPAMDRLHASAPVRDARGRS